MSTVGRSAIVNHSAQEMFSLVFDVDSYPSFLPWCDKASIAERTPGRTVATLRINFRGLKEEFTTENRDQPGEFIDMKLVSGPFRSLEGGWRFTPLSAGACKVELSLRYEFKSAILDKLVGKVFDEIANSLVDAFARRADQLFGRT
ncbi:MAG TPA: type II toxin-antitoxin system RatA family toxin [Burkholderiales bacterium]|nr:type II toxin-antitoxin system RatA family toxin [Burkholderiales bacterium]